MWLGSLVTGFLYVAQASLKLLILFGIVDAVTMACQLPFLYAGNNQGPCFI